MEYLQSLASHLSKVIAVREMRPPAEIRESNSTQGLSSSSNSEGHALTFGTSTCATNGEVANTRRCSRSGSRKRDKRPVTVGSRWSSSKNAVQFMNKLDRRIQMHAAKIGGRTSVASPTAMQVLRFVTLVDATGREHPILMQCCTSFEQLQAMLKIVLKNKSCDAIVQKRYLDAGLYDLSIDKGARVVQKQRSCKLYKCQLCGASNKVDCRHPTDWSGWLTEDSIDCQECGGRFQILLEKKNGKKSIIKTPEIDDDTRACIRNFRVDAISVCGLIRVSNHVLTTRYLPMKKHVAFCADGSEDVHEADDWDRSPVPVAQPLTYGDILELKALQRDLYLAPQSHNTSSVLLPRVPIPLLRLNP